MDASLIEAINTIFSLGTLISIAFCLFLLVGFISKDRGPAFSWLAKNTLMIVFLVSLAGLIGSLIYQYGVGFAPCLLCWYQRIVLYPIAIISLVALIKKHANAHVLSYSMVLALIGLLLSAYHNFEKIIGKELTSCDAVGVSCLQIYVKKFGFIDIPVMSLVFFVTIMLIILNRQRFINS